jgi:hypothetical protein
MRVPRSLVKAADGDEAAPGWSDLEAVRPIGDEIDRRVLQMLGASGSGRAGGPFRREMALLLALAWRKYIRKTLITSRDGRI